MLITNKKFREAILTALADDEMIKILNSTKKKSLSAIELIKLHDISHSTAYRKIKWMLENGLLVVDRIELRDDGKKFSLIKSTIGAVKVNYETDEVVIDVMENESMVSLSAKQFFSME